jgi:imidazole glycerol phosphate synthase subunit HisF
MGGVGTPGHIVEGLNASHVDAVATANLLNFIGTGLLEARIACGHARIALPRRLPVEAVQ